MSHRLPAALCGATLCLVAWSTASAQLPPQHAVIATKLTGTPVTQLLDVNLKTGKFLRLGRFQNDDRPPLALRVDPLSRDLLLAVGLAGGKSRILRIGLRGGKIVSVRQLADVTGPATDLAVPYPGDVFVGLDGTKGGLVHIPRNGGTAKQVLNAPRVAGINVLSISNAEVWLAESGTSTTPAQMRLYNTYSGRVSGPYKLASISPPQLTGIGELPGSIPTHVVADAKGQVWQTRVFQSPVKLPISPALPAGGTRALRVDLGSTGLVLGGTAHPYLESFKSWVLTPQKWLRVAGPFPGDPVSFDITGLSVARAALFGKSCSPAGKPPEIYTGGTPPTLGNQRFLLQTRGVPNSPAFLALGVSDQTYMRIPLPWSLPGGGCPLIVAADVLLLLKTDSTGFARQSLPVPNQASLSGAVFFGQWVHPLSGGTLLATTAGMALHVFP